MAHLLKLHGHSVGYLPPTYSSEIMYDSNTTEKEKIDGLLTDATLLTTMSDTSTSWVAKTVPSLSQYKYLMCALKAGSNLIETSLIPVSVFKTLNSSNAFWGRRVLLTSNALKNASIYYGSDTQIYCYIESDRDFALYGIK